MKKLIVIPFIVLMFLHVTEPQNNKIKIHKTTNKEKRRHGALKVVFGG